MSSSWYFAQKIQQETHDTKAEISHSINQKLFIFLNFYNNMSKHAIYTRYVFIINLF